MSPAPRFPPAGSLQRRIANALTGLNAKAYRASGGRLGGNVFGVPVLLLEHVGRRSGRRRVTPLHYTRDGDDVVVVASRGGSDATPDWWLNLRKNPRATIQIGRERREVVAREATPAERESLWPKLLERNPHYELYQGRTARQLAVVILSPG